MKLYLRSYSSAHYVIDVPESTVNAIHLYKKIDTDEFIPVPMVQHQIRAIDNRQFTNG